MPITNLDAVDFSKVPSLNFVAPVVAADPAPYESGLIYNSTEKVLKYSNGSGWVTLGAAGSSGPPTGAASGDLTGNYPSPQIAAGVIVDMDISGSANIAQGKILNLTADLAAKALGTTTMAAGAGLSGGGTLAANRSFDIGGGAGITVNADDIAVNRSVVDAWYQAAGATAGGDLSGNYPSPQIAAGAIVDADVNASAAIAQSKISGLPTALTGKADTGTTITAGNGLTGGGTLGASRTIDVGVGTGLSVAADAVSLDTTYTDNRYINTTGDTMTGPLLLAGSPTQASEAVTKAYVDIASQGYSFKSAVRVVAITNIALTGTQTIDGVAVAAGNRVLAAGQSTASANGIYVVAAGAWTRATDMDASGELVDGTLVPVAQGTLGADSQFMCVSTAADPWVPGTTASTWTRYAALADLQAGAGLTKSGNQIDFVTGDGTLSVGVDSVTVAHAPKLSTGRTITLTGAVTGVSAAFDGSSNLSFATTNAPGGIVDADVNTSANIAQSKISGLTSALGSKVDTTRQVIAGNGLTGGGGLTADATLNVVGDANLSVTADAVSVLSAPKWTTSRSITLTGDVTGTVTGVDGTGNISIATTSSAAGTVKKFAADIPAGTVGIVIAHNLGTLDVQTEVYQKSSGSTVYCDIVRSSINAVTLSFAQAVSAAAYRVVVTG